MALTVVESPEDFGLILNNIGYRVSSNVQDRSLQISVQAWIEDSPGSDSYSFVFQQDISPSSEKDVELFLNNLKSVLGSDQPKFNTPSPQLTPNTSRRYYISIGEKTDSNNVVISGNYVEDADPIKTETLDSNTASATEYLVVVEAMEDITDGDIKFRNSGGTQDLTGGIRMHDEIWFHVTSNDIYDKIDIPTYSKVTVFSNPVNYIDQQVKFILNGGINRQANTYLLTTTPESFETTVNSAESSKLTWKNIESDSVEIHRSTDGISFTKIATVQAETDSFIDESLLENTLYHYKIKYSNSGVFSDIKSKTINSTGIGQDWNIESDFTIT